MVIKVSTLLAHNTELVLDLSPSLGGALDTNNFSIANGINPVVISGNSYPTITGTVGQVLTTNGFGILSWTTGSIGTVTSVGLSITGPLYTVSNSPVISTGTLTATLNSQANNTFLSGPSAGGPLAPTFRIITAADLGTALQLYRENPSSPTTPVASGTNAIAIGSGARSTSVFGHSIGPGANASIYGQKALANGQFAVSGDAQHGIYVLRQQTSDVFGQSAIEMFLDGAAGTGTARIVMPNNSVFTFDILVAARRALVTGGAAAYRFVGAVKRDTTDGSVAFVGIPSKTIIGETNAAWNASLVVNTSAGIGGFTVNVTGEAGKTIFWVATVLTTEVKT